MTEVLGLEIGGANNEDVGPAFMLFTDVATTDEKIKEMFSKVTSKRPKSITIGCDNRNLRRRVKKIAKKMGIQI